MTRDFGSNSVIEMVWTTLSAAQCERGDIEWTPAALEDYSTSGRINRVGVGCLIRKS